VISCKKASWQLTPSLPPSACAELDAETELLLKLLQVDPGKRLTIPQIEQDGWFVQ